MIPIKLSDGMAIARVHQFHLTNAEQHQAATHITFGRNLFSNPTDRQREQQTNKLRQKQPRH